MRGLVNSFEKAQKSNKKFSFKKKLIDKQGFPYLFHIQVIKLELCAIVKNELNFWKLIYI